MVYLAQQQNHHPVLISEIATRKNIPLKFLENILLELKNNGILASKKGKGGGYYLNKSAHEIYLSNILRLVDGPIALLPCVSLNFYKKCENCDEGNCKLRDVLIEVRDATLAILENKTVADIT